VELGISLAIAGKGGTGKTTLSALIVRALGELQVRPALAVDADPNSNLAEALGVVPGMPLAQIREQGSSAEGSPPSGIGRARAIDDEIQRAIAESKGFDLITMGRPEGPRCYCYVNNLLRRSLDSLAANYAAVVMDNEAGMEHLSRRTTNNVDILVIVADCTLPAFRAAQRILALSHELPIRIGRRAVLLNRVGPGQAAEEIQSRLAGLEVERLADVPQDPQVEQAGAVGRDVFSLSDESPAVRAVRNLVQTLCTAKAV
jgi:CO dehydrogenase maturation factor